MCIHDNNFRHLSLSVVACVSPVMSVRKNLAFLKITEIYSHRFYSLSPDQPPKLIFFKQYLWKVAVGQRTVTESLQGAQAVVGSQVADKAYVHPVRSDVVFSSHAAGKIHSAAHELENKDGIKLHSTKRRKQNSLYQLKSCLEMAVAMYKICNMKSSAYVLLHVQCLCFFSPKILINKIQALENSPSLSEPELSRGV